MKRTLKTLAMAMGFPSAILGITIATFTLYNKKIIDLKTSLAITLLVVFGNLGLIVYYSINKKKNENNIINNNDSTFYNDN